MTIENDLAGKITIRDFGPDDYERVAEIYRTINPGNPVNAEDIRKSDEHLGKDKHILERRVALKDNTLVGVCHYSHQPSNFHPQKFFMALHVDPAWQHQGIGTALYERVIEELQRLNAIAVRASTKEDRIASTSFLRNRGFEEVNRSWEYNLAVQEFDPSKFQGYEAKVKEQGIAIATLEEETKDPECYRKLYSLALEVAADLLDVSRLTLEEFKQMLQRPDILPKGFFIAKDGNNYVGLSMLASEKQTLHQSVTGVRREYRGRGIATALKLRGIEFAKQYGTNTIKTVNDSSNQPIIAINENLGYKRQAGTIAFEKKLS